MERPPPELPNEPAPSIVRSLASVVSATAHPPPTSPSTSSCSTRASVKKTSLKMARPVISRIGRTSMPGWCMSMTKYVRPRCLGTSESVRAIKIPNLAMCAPEVQTFWPLTTHSSPSRRARVCSPARSEPAPGSLKSWHQTSPPVIPGRKRRLCASVPWAVIVGPARPWAMPAGGPSAPTARRTAARPRVSCGARPRPYQSTGHVGKPHPESARSRHHSPTDRSGSQFASNQAPASRATTSCSVAFTTAGYRERTESRQYP